jgi:hypothetical protein
MPWSFCVRFVDIREIVDHHCLNFLFSNRFAASSDNVYQLLAHGRWFSPGTPASFTTKPGCHNIAEILLKMALSTINQIKSTLFEKRKFKQ